jgi:uncharacterized protein YfiM (DUF2279 family)
LAILPSGQLALRPADTQAQTQSRASRRKRSRRVGLSFRDGVACSDEGLVSGSLAEAINKPRDNVIRKQLLSFVQDYTSQD